MQRFFSPPSEVKETKLSPIKQGVHYLSYEWQKNFLVIRPYLFKYEEYLLFLKKNPHEQTNRSLIDFLTQQREYWINKKSSKDHSGQWDVNKVIDTLTKTICMLETALDTSFYEADIPKEIFEKEFKPNTVYFNRKEIAAGLGYVAMGFTLEDALHRFESATEYGYAGKINISREWIVGQLNSSSKLILKSNHYKPPSDEAYTVYFAHCRRPEEVLTFGTQYSMQPDINNERHASVLVFNSFKTLLNYTNARESDHHRNEYGERKHSKWTSAQLSALDIVSDPDALMAHHSQQSRAIIPKIAPPSKEDEIERRPLLRR